MTDTLRLVSVEDQQIDAELVADALAAAGLAVWLERVDDEAGFLQAIKTAWPDAILVDWTLPRFSGRRALEIARERCPEVPCIVVSGTIQDAMVIEALHLGATDCIPKNQLELLAPALNLALEHARRQRVIREQETMLREMSAMAHIGAWRFDPATGRGAWTEETTRIFGLPPETELVVAFALGFFHGPWRERIEVAVREASELGKPYDLEVEMVTAEGNRKWIHTMGIPVLQDGRVVEVRGAVQDITERKQNEEHIQSLTRALRTLSSCNVALVHAQTEEELFRNVCRNIVEIGGHLLAWVSYPGEGAEAAPLPFAHAGDDTLFRLHAGLDDVPEHRRNCLTLAALRERKTQVCNRVQERREDAFDPLREAGVAAILALPLLYQDEIYGVLTVFSSAAETFGADEIKLMEELASDLAYGIVTLRTRTERDRGAASLRLALEQTIAAISLTLEKRDPYTAGHQQRVARIARAIAVEMGLSERRVAGIHFGALIHDIGKVYVPAEILNRPGRLTALEFGLIQTHSEVGFDIVKEIPFPWPVAQMIHQHHERLDGSGYPQGLKGDEIMLEARILAVADVLEAMASHRPYRAALGIEAGLDEIVRQRGRHFDPAAVDACVRLLREKGFRLEADSPEARR